MPSSDWKVELVDANGDPDYTVAVVGDQVVNLAGAADGDVLTVQANGLVAPEAPASDPAAVPKALYDAESLLVAVTDNTPVALTVAASRIVGRKASGDIAALTGAEVAAITGSDALVVDSIADSDTTHAPSRNAVFDALVLKANDAAVVHNSLFDAGTLLYAAVDDTPVVKTPTEFAIITGGRALIQRQVLGGAAATIDFQNIPQTFENLVLEVMGRGDNASGFIRAKLTINNDTGNNYDSQDVFGNVTTAGAAQGVAGAYVDYLLLAAASATANASGSFIVRIPSYARTTFRKMVHGKTVSPIVADGSGVVDVLEVGAQWRSTAAINRLTLTASAGNFIAGTVASLYGEG